MLAISLFNSLISNIQEPSVYEWLVSMMKNIIFSYVHKFHQMMKCKCYASHLFTQNEVLY